jgi:hypothetical protein
MSRYHQAVLALVAAGLWGCGGHLASIAPSGLAPVPGDSLGAWLAGYQPPSRVQYDLRWRFVNPKGATAGRAVVRIAPPDSLRFDYRGPFGRSGAAVIIGDSARWVVPEKETQDLVPAAPLFWAALAVPQPPPPGAATFARSAPGRAWRYVTGPDTMDFVEVGSGPERLLIEVRQQGKIVASTEVKFQNGTRQPLESRMRFPRDGAALILTMVGWTPVPAFDESTWRRP